MFQGVEAMYGTISVVVAPRGNLLQPIRNLLDIEGEDGSIAPFEVFRTVGCDTENA